MLGYKQHGKVFRDFTMLLFIDTLLLFVVFYCHIKRSKRAAFPCQRATFPCQKSLFCIVKEPLSLFPYVSSSRPTLF